MRSLDSAIKLLEQKEMELKFAVKTYNNLKLSLKKEQRRLSLLEKARSVIINLGEKTQEKAKTEMEEAVTMALQSVFGEEYREFILQYDSTKRDQIELKFFINHLGNLIEPREDTAAGGAIDICAFALQIVLWAKEENVPPVLVLDEPFKNISAGYLKKAIDFVKTISEILGIQIIMITHIDSFIENADNVLLIDNEN